MSSSPSTIPFCSVRRPSCAAVRQPSTDTRWGNAKGGRPQIRPKSAVLGRCAPCTSPAKMPDGCWMEGGPGQAPLLGYSSLQSPVSTLQSPLLSQRQMLCCAACNANAGRPAYMDTWSEVALEDANNFRLSEPQFRARRDGNGGVLRCSVEQWSAAASSSSGEVIGMPPVPARQLYKILRPCRGRKCALRRATNLPPSTFGVSPCHIDVRR